MFTLRQAEGAEVALRLTVEPGGSGRWTAHSRPGAAAEFVGRRRAIAGRLLGRMPPHGALVNIVDGTVRAVGDSVEVRGRFESGLLGSYVLVAGVVDGRLHGDLRRDSLALPAWSVDAAPHPAPGPLRDYRALAERIEDGFRSRIYDPALVERREFRSFFREVHRRMARAVDDGDAMAAFYAVRPRLDISHIELFRHPVIAATPLDSLLTASGTAQQVFLSFPAPGVALLRITRWADVTGEVGRAFERIDSAGSHTLVLDVRWNPGGDVTSMAPASHLLPDSTMVGVFLGRRWYANRSSPPSPAELHALPVISDGTSLSLINHVLDSGAVVGVVPPSQPQFPGDVYLLINERSGSSSEPLAHLLRTTGRATLVGERTAGAMLSGPPRPAGDGWVLIVPEADYFAADGARLEGTGVPPHVPVASDRALNAVAHRLADHAPYAAALLDGAGHVEGSRWSLAAESYGVAQRLEPDSLAPAMGLGRAHSELRQWEAAFQAFDTMLARRPEVASALYQVGRLAALSGQRLADGEVALRRYLGHTPEPGQPTHAAAHWRLGMIMEAGGRDDEARAEYRAAVELEPHVSAYTEALQRLAMAASAAASAVEASTPAAPDPLPRRAAFGAQIETQPSDAEVRGVLIRGVLAGLSAEQSGLRTGDIVVALAGVAVEGVPQFLALLRGRPAGDALPVEFVRDGGRHQVTLVLREMPRESYDDIEVVYDHIDVNGARLRTILTHPRGVTGRLPTVVVAGGVGCYSVDVPLAEPGGYARILNELTRLSYATMRVEKSGMGDSEGQPCASQSFFDEQAGYIEAVRAVRRYPFVDGDQVFLFGHSMGGVHAPLVADAVAMDAPLAGLMVMGTVGTSWFAYEMENGRRQLPLYGVPADEVEARLTTEGRCVAALVAEKRAPDDIVGEWPECAESMEFPAHYTYRRQVMDLNMPGNWRRVSVPVLAMYGASDFLTSAAEHFYIGGLVNHRNPGSATVRIVDGLDHYFQAVPSQQESVRASQGGREAEYDPRVHHELHQWMTRVRSGER